MSYDSHGKQFREVDCSKRSDAEYRYRDGRLNCSHSYLVPVLHRYLQDLTHNASIIDLGCGNGAVLGELCGRGWRLCGLDISNSGLQQATRAHRELTFERADVTSDLCAHPLWGQCDVVISLEVVEHIFVPRAFARNCYGFLKPGGRLILSTPYHGYLKNLALSVSGKLDSHFTALWDFGHVKFWSRKTLSMLMIEQGFERLEIRGVGRAPYLWKSMVLSAFKPSK